MPQCRDPTWILISFTGVFSPSLSSAIFWSGYCVSPHLVFHLFSHSDAVVFITGSYWPPITLLPPEKGKTLSPMVKGRWTNQFNLRSGHFVEGMCCLAGVSGMPALASWRLFVMVSTPLPTLIPRRLIWTSPMYQFRLCDQWQFNISPNM